MRKTGSSFVLRSDGTLRKELRFTSVGSIASDNRVMILDGKIFFFGVAGKLQYLDYLGQDSVVSAKKEDILDYLERGQEYLTASSKFRQELEDFLSKNSVLLHDGRLFFYRNDQCFEYITMLRGYFKRKDRANATFIGIRQFLGYDAHGNMYLKVRIAPRQFDKFLIVSKYGEYLAFVDFDYGRAMVDGPSLMGDIYFKTDEPLAASQIREEGLYYYRIRNTWDVISEDEAAAFEKIVRSGVAQIATPPSLKLTAISDSSALAEPSDKNAYHPVKLFDGDPTTMWIENAKGPGIGESVTVGFDAPVTADEIQFMPGAFWKEYWKQNYRVKKLEVKLDDKVFTASFKDEMTVQSLKLSSSVTFKTAVFTIKDVYPSTKWEDTAISEITFYNQGAKVEVDYSKFKEFLNKAP